ncbi:MAG: VOC family protein [Candidatus Hodarchaeota archaeon]
MKSSLSSDLTSIVPFGGVYLDLDSKDQIDKIYNKVKEKGYKILMELEKTFWGAYFARFEDPEGIGWQLNYNENV